MVAMVMGGKLSRNQGCRDRALVVPTDDRGRLRSGGVAILRHG
jgi:hypothetical protein